MQINQGGFEELSLSNRFARGAFWSLAGTALSRLSTFLGAVIIARFLGQTGYGELAMIQSTIGLFGTFGGLGLGMTATKYVAEFKSQDPDRTGRIIGFSYLASWTVGGILACICFWGAPWFASHTLNAPHLAGELRLASLLLFVSMIFGPQTGILAGFQAFRTLAKVNFCQGLLSLPLTALLVWWGGLRGVIIALILTSLIGAAVSSLFLSRKYRAYGIKFNFIQSFSEKAIIWQFSFPFFLSGIVHTAVIWAANAVLANQPKGYAELGLFNVSMQFYYMVMMASGILASVSVPMFSEIFGKKDTGLYTRFLNVQLMLVWNLSIALGCLVLILSPWLLQIFGEKYQAAGSILPLTICAAITVVALNILGQAFYTSNRVWLAFLITLMNCVIFMTAVKYLVPLYGAIGLALAYLIAYSLEVIIRIFLVEIILYKLDIKRIITTSVLGSLLINGCALYLVFNGYQWFLLPVLIGGFVFIIFSTINSNLVIFDNLLFNSLGVRLIRR
jgi:O-antigen/teichoic acid export membrane protein